jgi:trehalose-6-phosphate synthase
MEFTLAKQKISQLDSKYNNSGLVIISEFVSSARVMRGSIIVNPWKIYEVIFPPR